MKLFNSNQIKSLETSKPYTIRIFGREIAIHSAQEARLWCSIRDRRIKEVNKRAKIKAKIKARKKLLKAKNKLKKATPQEEQLKGVVDNSHLQKSVIIRFDDDEQKENP